MAEQRARVIAATASGDKTDAASASKSWDAMDEEYETPALQPLSVLFEYLASCVTAP
jgi:hypothetical protein